MTNLIGQGLGPTAVALLTDYLFHDDMAVGHSLLIVIIAGLTVATLLLMLAMAPFRASYARQYGTR